MTLTQVITRIVEPLLPKPQVTGTVISVNKQDMTCDVDIHNKPTRFDVRLRAVVNREESGFFLIPKLKSKVIIANLEGLRTASYVAMFSEVEEIILVSDKNGGIIINSKLTTEIEKLNTNFKTLLNAVKTAPVVAQDGGASFKSALSAALQFNDADLSDVESKTVKHG